MKQLFKVFYAIGILGLAILLVGAGPFDCDCHNPDLTRSWVTCIDGHPTLTDGTETIDYKDGKFNPNDYACPKNPLESPEWVHGSQPAPFPLSSQTSANASPKGRAAAGGTVAYVPRILLDLPFGPSPFPKIGLSTCDATSPDILQVNHVNSLVTRLTTCPFAVKKTIRVASRPLQIAITPDGQMALVTSFDNAINFIDLNTNTVVFTLSVFFNPHGIAITSDGKTAYVASFDNINSLIATIDIASRTVTKTVQTNAYPQSVFLSPDDSQLYITFPFGNAMFIMDTMTGIVGNTFAITAPRGVAFNSRGSKAFITSATGGSSGSVLQFDTETFQVERTYSVGAGPTDIAVMYDEVTVVVVNNEGGSTSTINLKTGQVTTLALGAPAAGLAILR